MRIVRIARGSTGRAARLLVAAALGAALASACAASRAGTGYGVPLGGGPRALVREPSHVFGEVEPGAVVRHRFEIANVGDQPLEIASLVPSCGCTATVLASSSVASWGTTVVEVALDTSGLAGEQSKAVRVRTNDPAVAEIELTLHGSVKSDVSAEPQRVFLGRLAPGEIETRVVNVVVHEPDVALTGVRSEGGRVEVAVAPLDPPLRGMRLLLTLRSGAGAGRLDDRVVVSTTSSRQPEIRIPVLASVEAGGVRRRAAAGAPSGHP